MTYEIKKVFDGYASVRDYVVDECIEKNEPLEIVKGDEVMVLSPKELKEKREQKTDMIFTSKWGDKEYQLYDYKFEPTKQIKLNL